MPEKDEGMNDTSALNVKYRVKNKDEKNEDLNATHQILNQKELRLNYSIGGLRNN